MAGRSPDPGARSPRARLTAEEFAALYQEAARILWTIAAGVLGDPTEAEDVLQEACVMALGKLEQFEPGTSFQAWMGRFVRNVALNQRRKRVRRSTEAVDPTVAGALERPAREPAGGPADGLPIEGSGALRADQAAFDDRVLAALQELAEEPRATLLLRTVLGLSYREIAATLEIPEGTAMSHVHRSREALRALLSEPAPGGRPARAEEPGAAVERAGRAGGRR